MIDLLVVSMPLIESESPTAGIFYIKGAAEAIGCKSIAKDLNFWFTRRTDINIPAIQNYFMQHNISAIDETSDAHIQTQKIMELYFLE